MLNPVDVLHARLRQLDRELLGGAVEANTSTRYWAEELVAALRDAHYDIEPHSYRVDPPGYPD